MSCPADKSDHGSVAFFARVSAAVSHEINNVLATLQESAGLLNDYLGLAERGRELDPVRLKKVASRMTEQVRRGQEIVARMNRFAHSGDQAVAEVDLSETVELICHLFARPASVAGMSLEYQGDGPRVRLCTRPFVLEALLWHILELAAEGASEHPRCLIGVRPAPGGATVDILGCNPLIDNRQGAENKLHAINRLADLGAIWKPANQEPGLTIFFPDQAGQVD